MTTDMSEITEIDPTVFLFLVVVGQLLGCVILLQGRGHESLEVRKFGSSGFDNKIIKLLNIYS